MKWILLILSLPTQNATVRMRLWRSLKSAGAAVLRDGVYLLPQRPEHQQLFDGFAQEVEASKGSAYVLFVDSEDASQFSDLFDRRDEYAKLLQELPQIQELAVNSLQEAIRQLRKLRKNFTAITVTDFFPDEAQVQTQQALQRLERKLNRQLSPNEPHEHAGEIPRLDVDLYRGRLWATRSRPWVDRLASAWLISRFIDPEARFVWLQAPQDCPTDALGFDFDGASFTHLNGKVTFEVLLESFGLEHPCLARMGALVHFLDAGGIQPSEACGLEQILWGLRNSIHDDDQLIITANGVFDALLAAFTDKETV